MDSLCKVPDEELNPVRREARSHDEKDVGVKRPVVSYDGRDQLRSRVMFIVKHNVGSKPPDCGCALSFFLSVVGCLGAAWAKGCRVDERLHFSITLMPGKIARAVGTSKAVERSMEKNTFDATAVVLALSFIADSVNVFPGLSVETRSTSRALSYVGRQASLLFQAVDVLGVVPNQLASIAQGSDETVCSSWLGAFSDPTHIGDVPVEATSVHWLREGRRTEQITTARRIDALFVFGSKVLVWSETCRKKRS